MKLKENYSFFIRDIKIIVKFYGISIKKNHKVIEVTILRSNLFPIIPSLSKRENSDLGEISVPKGTSSMDGLHMYMYNTRVSYSLPLRLFHSAISHSERFLSRKEERNLPPFFFEEALPRNLAYDVVSFIDRTGAKQS